MKEILLSLITISILSACSIDEEIPMVTEMTTSNFFEDSLSFCTSLSDPVTFSGLLMEDSLRLKKVVSSSLYFNSLRVSTDSFLYDPITQRPLEILNANSSTNRTVFYYDEQLLLTTVELYDSSQQMNELPKQYDLLKYDAFDNLISIERFRLDNTQSYELAEKNQFNYMDGLLSSSIRTSFSNNSESKLYYRYCWENQNLIQSRSYDNDGDLLVESFYEYDEQSNFNRLNPTKYFFPSTWSKNNITKTTSRSSVVAIESLCGNPCIYNFEYNDAGFPTELSDPSGFFHVDIFYD